MVDPEGNVLTGGNPRPRPEGPEPEQLPQPMDLDSDEELGSGSCSLDPEECDSSDERAFLRLITFCFEFNAETMERTSCLLLLPQETVTTQGAHAMPMPLFACVACVLAPSSQCDRFLF